MSEEEGPLARLREKEAQLLRLREAVRHRSLAATEREALGELSTVDNHPADVADATVERGKDLGTVQRIEALLGEVRAAERRVLEGTYGVCAVCRKPIPAARLEVLPWATTCAECQEQLERSQVASDRRPVEEEVLADVHPWAEGEDVLRILGHVGMAEGPQDVPPSVGYEDLYELGDVPPWEDGPWRREPRA